MESGVAIQSAEFQQLHLKMPFHKPHEATSWVVDRQEQIYFVAQGGGFREVPYQFALVLPRRGITVQVEGWMNARGSVAQGFVNTWRITRVKVAREHESEALRLLDLVRQAMKAMYLSLNPGLTREVHVELPEPTFT